MKRKKFVIACVAASGLAAGLVLTKGHADAGPTGERPELARAGAFGIGTIEQDFALAPRVRITAVGAVTGNLPVEPRSVKVRFWYPAQIAANAPRARYTHDVAIPGKPVFAWATQGVAVTGATALAGTRFPLVLFSHGYAGWSEHSSNLAEALAEKGYVVAAINHGDLPFDSTPSFLVSFGNVLLDRAQDQREVLGQIIKRASTEKFGFVSEIDTSNIGLIGYSMGGYGALATAGAPYDAKSKTMSQLPASAQKALLQSDPASAARIKALVAIAPWGGQPDNRVWSTEALSQIKMPVLVVAGDQDDVVNFKQGVSWIFDNLKGTDRRMLVYREARHNIAGNPVVTNDQTDFQTLEFFNEPVWRTERLNMINQHLISAFFDLTLKGDKTKAAYLELPSQASDDGDWPSAPGEQLGGKFAGAEQPKYWRGFQRRWAVGLEMRKAAKGQ
jgi:predicted dienelactone hydrolase